MTSHTKLEHYLDSVQQEIFQTIAAMNHLEFQATPVLPRDGHIMSMATAVPTYAHPAVQSKLSLLLIKAL